MAGTPDHPLTVAEAKARLRQTAGEVGVVGYVRRRPYTALLVAVAVGAFFGRSPQARAMAVRETARLLARAL